MLSAFVQNVNMQDDTQPIAINDYVIEKLESEIGKEFYPNEDLKKDKEF